MKHSSKAIENAARSTTRPAQQHGHDYLPAPCWLLALLCLLCGSWLASCNPLTTSAPKAVQHSANAFPPSAFPSHTDTIPINKPVATIGCGKAAPVAAGRSVNETIGAHPAEAEGYQTRSYLLHVPATYQADIPTPVVLIFHGHGGSAAGMEGIGFSRLADQQDFIAVYPQGLPEGRGGPSFWADIGPIDDGIDDVLFVSDLLNTLQKEFCVDAHRIYATGFSNGGGMTNFLACRLAGRIAAFAPISGDHYPPPGGCQPGRPISLLEINGTADPLVPYNGIPVSEELAWPESSIPQYLQEWATRDGCTGQPAIFLQSAKVLGEQWTNCPAHATIMHYRMIGEGHSWPASIGDVSGTETIWQFLLAHPLP